LLNASTRDIWLAPGDLLVIDNRRAVHGRPAFRSSFSGRRRWMQRAYVRKRSEAVGRVGRVVD
jgi:alpha-ketoglutarate-dependent taurine dioxygenase